MLIYMFSRLPVYRGGTENRMQSQSPPIEDTPTPSQLIYIFIGQIKDRAFYAMIAVLEKKNRFKIWMGHIINQSLNDDTTIPWHKSSRVLLIKTRV